jgi:hypothetical protein
MVEFSANHFYWAIYHLHELRRLVDEAIADQDRGATGLPNRSEADRTRRLLKRIENSCDPIVFDSVFERIDLKFNRHEPLLQPLSGRRPFTLQELSLQLAELNDKIAEVLGANKFLIIPGADTEFFDNYLIFGFDVAKKFPEASKEIVAAGTCYAAACYSACVFHLMRAVELGARSMVNSLKVRQHLIRGGHSMPVELCDWGTLIAALDKGVAALATGTRTSKSRKNKFEFYNHAVGSFRNFKDAWRNNVSHMRKSYGQSEAKDVLENTRQFMKHLATKLKE